MSVAPSVVGITKLADIRENTARIEERQIT